MTDRRRRQDTAEDLRLIRRAVLMLVRATRKVAGQQLRARQLGGRQHVVVREQLAVIQRRQDTIIERQGLTRIQRQVFGDREG